MHHYMHGGPAAFRFELAGDAAKLEQELRSASLTIGPRVLVFDLTFVTSRRILSVQLVPYAVSACFAYGFWLAALRHDAGGAAAMARGFVAGIGQTASAPLSGRAKPGYDRSPHGRVPDEDVEGMPRLSVPDVGKGD